MIQLFSTTNNYNTKQTECLHINFTKNEYCVSNHKDEITQMTKWLECQEKIQQHSEFLDWQKQQVGYL